MKTGRDWLSKGYSESVVGNIRLAMTVYPFGSKNNEDDFELLYLEMPLGSVTDRVLAVVREDWESSGSGSSR